MTDTKSLSWLILPAIMLVGLIFRLYTVGDHGFFIDEIYSVQVANGNADPELMDFDSIRPLYFAFLKLWMNLGDSEVWLRLPSVFFGTLNIALTCWLGTITAGKRAGLAAAMLLALSPLEVHYSQEVRMYTMGSCLGLAGSIALIKAWRDQSNVLFFTWAALRTLLIWTLPLTVVLVPVDFLLSMLKGRRSKLMPTFLISLLGLAMGSLVFAWKMPLVSLCNAYDTWRYTLPIPSIGDMFMVLVNFTSTTLPIQECVGPKEGGDLAVLYSATVFAMVGLTLLAVRTKHSLIWCIGWAFVPIVVAYLASQIGPGLLIVRYILFAAPFTFILIGSGFNQLCSKSVWLAAAQTILYLIIVLQNLAYFAANPVHEDWHMVAAAIEKDEQAGDKIIAWNYHTDYVVRYYYKGKNQIYDLDVIAIPPTSETNAEGSISTNSTMSTNSETAENTADKNMLQDVELGATGLNQNLDQNPNQNLEPNLNKNLNKNVQQKKFSGRTWIIMRQALKSLKQARHTYELVHARLRKNYKILKYEQISNMDIFLVTDKDTK